MATLIENINQLKESLKTDNEVSRKNIGDYQRSYGVANSLHITDRMRNNIEHNNQMIKMLDKCISTASDVVVD